jgi:hypothetical protein
MGNQDQLIRTQPSLGLFLKAIFQESPSRTLFCALGCLFVQKTPKA